MNSKSQHLSPLTTIYHPLFEEHQLSVQVKRDDLIHTVISGNKWRKLKYNLRHIQESDYCGALTFGGAYSNHIHAFAYACKQNGIPCIGIIRGEEEHINNATLRWASHWGMKLVFVDRKTYRRRFDSAYLTELQATYPDYFIIPEGGSNELALNGVADVINELNHQTEFDTLITAVGSGGTLAGLILGDIQSTLSIHNILGIAVLKQGEYLNDEVKGLLGLQNEQHQHWNILTDFHGGGYGKFSENDIERIIDFNNQVNITFEPIYTGKMILAFLDLVEQGYFKVGEKIVLLHTGGLQGLGGLIERGKLDVASWPSLPVL